MKFGLLYREGRSSDTLDNDDTNDEIQREGTEIDRNRNDGEGSSHGLVSRDEVEGIGGHKQK